MKIIVTSTYAETVQSTTTRCSDGHYKQCDYTNSINIYADSDQLSVIVAKEITNFINKHTNHGHDKVWDWSYKGTSTEEINVVLTEKLIALLGSQSFEQPEDSVACNVLLNEIASTIYNKHNSDISALRRKQSEIHKKYLRVSEKCKANFVIKMFLENETHYQVNSKMPDFDEFLLDFAMNADNIDFLDYLISIGAKTVSNTDSFTLWLCEKGKFEHLYQFVNVKEKKLEESNYYNSQKNEYYKDCGFGDKFIVNFLLNTIAHNKPELFFEFGKLPNGQYPLRLWDRNSNPSSTLIGQYALSKSNNETIKVLADNNIKYFYWLNKLDERCFKDDELTDLFLKKAPTDSLYTLFKAGRTDFIKKLIEMNCSDFSEVELSKFRQFFIPENDYIIKSIASKTTLSLAKRIYEPRETYSYLPMENFMVDSVIEIYMKQQRFHFAKQLFEISNKNEEVTSYDAGRLLFKLCKYDVELGANDFKELLLEYIKEDDLTKLMSIAFFENNPHLLKFIVPKVKDVNSPVHKYIGHFGLANPKQSYSYHRKDKDSKDGTLLHSMVSFGKCLSVELIQFLINAGVDITKSNNDGKVAFDCLRSGKTNDSQAKELAEILYVEGCDICYNNGDLFYFLRNTELPVVKRFENYTNNGINAINAYEANDNEALEFFISCGAKIETLKKEVELKYNKKKSKIQPNTTEFIDTSPTQKELDDMYRDAFDGFDDAVWNID